MPDSEAINKIFSRYEEKRELAANKRRQRIDGVYKSVPRIKEIDNEINMRGMRNVQNILREPNRHKEFNEDLKINLDRLENEKKELLQRNNIPENYAEYEYECKLCSDTGYTPDGKQCTCFKQSVLNEAYNASNIGELIKKQNFESFSFNYYSKEKGSFPDTPYNNMERIYKRAVNFCSEFDNSDRSMLFYGTTGLGKTHLSCAIAKRLIEAGKIVLYVRASKLFSRLGDYKFGREKDKSFTDSLYSCDLLIIDDLGTEAANRINTSLLFDVIDERLSTGKKVLISTNLSLTEIGKVYSMRMTSRIVENFIICQFYGEDIRYKKIYE